MKELEAIKARAEAATEGPWFAHQEYIDMGVPDAHQTVTDSAERYAGKFIASVGLYSDVKDANAEFVSHARTDIPKLLAALEAVLNLANHEPRFRSRMFGGEYFPLSVSADEITEVITEALA